MRFAKCLIVILALASASFSIALSPPTPDSGMYRFDFYRADLAGISRTDTTKESTYQLPNGIKIVVPKLAKKAGEVDLIFSSLDQNLEDLTSIVINCGSSKERKEFSIDPVAQREGSKPTSEQCTLDRLTAERLGKPFQPVAADVKRELSFKIADASWDNTKLGITRTPNKRVIMMYEVPRVGQVFTLDSLSFRSFKDSPLLEFLLSPLAKIGTVSFKCHSPVSTYNFLKESSVPLDSSPSNSCYVTSFNKGNLLAKEPIVTPQKSPVPAKAISSANTKTPVASVETTQCASDMVPVRGDGAFRDFCITGDVVRVTMHSPRTESDDFTATLADAKAKCASQSRQLCSFEQREQAKILFPYPKPGAPAEVGKPSLGVEWVSDPIPADRVKMLCKTSRDPQNCVVSEGTSTYWGSLSYGSVTSRLPFHCCKNLKK